jgi:hypothetical protein
MPAPLAVAKGGRVVAGQVAPLPVVEPAPAYAQAAGNMGNGLALGGFDQGKGALIQSGGTGRA